MKLVTLILALITIDALPTMAGDHLPGRPLARETLRVEFPMALFPDSSSVVLRVKVTNIGPNPIYLPRALHRFTRFTTRHGKATHVLQPTDQFSDRRYEPENVCMEPGDSYEMGMQFKASHTDAIRMTLALPSSERDSQTPRGSLTTGWFLLVGLCAPIPTLGCDLPKI